MILPRDARPELAILFDKRSQQLDSLTRGPASLQPQPHQIHAEQSEGHIFAFAMSFRGHAEGPGEQGFVADSNTVLVDTFFISPAPVGARSEVCEGLFDLWNGDIFQLEQVSTGPGFSRLEDKRLAIEDRTIAILGKDD